MLTTAGGFALLLTLTPTTHPWVIAVALCLVGLGAGVGLTLTNDLIMSSVTPEESGQAAAISNTGYELGTSFGIAILGSVLLGFYRTRLVDLAPQGLPAEVLEGAKETLAAALLYAQQLPGEIGAALATAAADSFTTALAWTGGIAAAILPGWRSSPGSCCAGSPPRPTSPRASSPTPTAPDSRGPGGHAARPRGHAVLNSTGRRGPVGGAATLGP